MDRASVLYGAVTALYTAAVILKVIRGGLKLGLWWVFSLFLVFVGMPLCFIKLPGYSGLLLLSLGYLIYHSMLARSEKLLLVGNKAILITGCDSGFGHALAKHLDKLGFTVFAGVLNAQGLGSEELRRSGSERLVILQMDVTDTAQIEQAYLQVKFHIEKTGEVPIPGFAAYGASKAALSRFSGVMRQELSKWGVKVATIQPGGFQTIIWVIWIQRNY
ncbi:17-beta-hydroxysteroid dehydrogenase type 2-like isoform X2 [Acipenser ruthenus]|uniref:17-beta-hydroxysteroid dehydrogenase type 2-like isoform X2 n=1 Tax=Acipenser ruthenus TaxID=7906 RepID=UPI00274166E9|nr:17-beta-hydroxysteroid dehydrogenase type 2-like isoform X2 [Acipenser ruthenus]